MLVSGMKRNICENILDSALLLFPLSTVSGMKRNICENSLDSALLLFPLSTVSGMKRNICENISHNTIKLDWNQAKTTTQTVVQTRYADV